MFAWGGRGGTGGAAGHVLSLMPLLALVVSKAQTCLGFLSGLE